MMAETSASMWPRVKKSIAERCEGGRADLALVGLIGPVGDKIDTELAFGRFNSRIDLTGRNRTPGFHNAKAAA